MAQDAFGNWLPNNQPPTPNNPPFIGAASGQTMSGAFDDPNGNVTPPIISQAAFYTKDQSMPVELWGWSIKNQSWFPMIT